MSEPRAILACPECHASGEQVCGHQIQGVYDGVLYWSCFECGHVWPRDFGDWERLNVMSRHYALLALEARQA